MSSVEIIRHRPSAADVRRILDALPEWFGLEAANAAYIEDSQRLPAYVALADGDVVGVLLLKHHAPESSEVHLLAVIPELHQHGIGSALLGTAELDLAATDCRFLQVKTLGPSDPDEFYARTRRFYGRRGFVALEEFSDLWPGNPCLQMVKSLQARDRA